MTPEELQKRLAQTEEAMENLRTQFNAQMNYWAGQKALLEELLAPAPTEKEEVSS